MLLIFTFGVLIGAVLVTLLPTKMRDKLISKVDERVDDLTYELKQQNIVVYILLVCIAAMLVTIAIKIFA